MRQLAWLHATPKPPKGTKRENAAEQEPVLSRLEQQKANNIPLRMPPNPSPHIIKRFIEIGMSESNGMSSTTLSWREINEWQRATHVALAPWEARLIRHLSAEYLGEGRRAEDENCPAPWRAEVTQVERNAEPDGLRALFREMSV